MLCGVFWCDAVAGTCELNRQHMICCLLCGMVDATPQIHDKMQELIVTTCQMYVNSSKQTIRTTKLHTYA